MSSLTDQKMRKTILDLLDRTEKKRLDMCMTINPLLRTICIHKHTVTMGDIIDTQVSLKDGVDLRRIEILCSVDSSLQGGVLVW